MTFKNSYSSTQTDTNIITPSSGKKLYIWNVVIETDDNGELNFNTSGIQVAILETTGILGMNNVNKIGAVDESLSLTCDGNTEVTILYDEI